MFTRYSVLTILAALSPTLVAGIIWFLNALGRTQQFPKEHAHVTANTAVCGYTPRLSDTPGLSSPLVASEHFPYAAWRFVARWLFAREMESSHTAPELHYPSVIPPSPTPLNLQTVSCRPCSRDMTVESFNSFSDYFNPIHAAVVNELAVCMLDSQS